ncbi:DNA polymerase III subunit delta' C-terminal domain-containing protein, partial [Klebsiella pneumoniae]|uniref:DNA polymerase III subunit delta' C-terminal domain-containing protein n=1 Tax=Klebsiella pneumoniae TaxID=573 RepID=UPI0025578086
IEYRQQRQPVTARQGSRQRLTQLLPILNHEQAAVRLHWLASLLVDAQKRQQGITLVSNPDVWPLLEQLA